MASQKENKSIAKIPSLDDIMYDDPGEELRKDGCYYITGDIEIGGLVHIQQDILVKHRSGRRKDIELIINSPGGDVAEGWALIDLLKFVRMDCVTIGMGECASLGTMILAAGTKGKRVVAPNCSLMIHGFWTKSFIEGDKVQMDAKMKFTDQEHERQVKFWIEHSKYKTAKQVVDNLLINKDLYLTAEGALKHGIVDKLLVRSKK